MIKIVEGDLLKSDADIICHQVNSMGVMGSGLAWQIRREYEEVFVEYYNLCRINSPSRVLGMCQIVKCNDGRRVANLFGQLNYGRDKIHTNYEALGNALTLLVIEARANNWSVGIPYNIGCALGGGDWDIVSTMIHNAFEGYDKVTIYKLV